MNARMMMTALVLLVLGLPAQACAVAGQAAGQGHDHPHDHLHDGRHDHAHSAASEATRTVAKGYFDDCQIAPRPLTDWQGEWQSVFPLLLGGQLDAVMADKAAQGDKTAAEYKNYYRTGYATDVDRIGITDDMVTFHRAGTALSGRYVEDGYEILTYEKGNRGVRFIFRKIEGDAAAPGFIQFSDHKIAPEAADHYHLYWGEDRREILTQLTNWPTYYPARLSPQDIAAEMMAH